MAEARVAPMIMVAAERIEELSFSSSLLNIRLVYSKLRDMPITKSASKKMRVDKRRTAQNMTAKGRLKTTIKEVRANPSVGTLKTLYSAMDHAVKHHLVTKGHAARLKSRISKLGKK